jgi:peptide/nickel transport system substrate-binding protein
MDELHATRALPSRRLFLRGLNLALAGAALAACGAPAAPTAAPAKPTEGAKPAAAATAPAAPAATTAPAAAPAAATKPAAAAPTVLIKPEIKAGGQSIWGQVGEPVSLNPHNQGTTPNAEGNELFYESLTAYDAKGDVVPSLALSWENPTPTSYLWKLRPNVKFHDGSPFNAETVKYNVERILTKENAAPFLFTFNSITAVEVVDPLTVRFTTSRPDPGLPGAFAMKRNTSMIPTGMADKIDLNLKGIGTGPYKLVEYAPNSHLIYEKNKEYWGAPLPYLDRITYKILNDEETRIAALRTRQIDGSQISATGADRLKDQPGLVIHKTPIYNLLSIHLNINNPPLGDVRVRKAISMGLDRPVFIQKIENGLAQLSGPIATGYQDWFIPVEQLPYKYDPEGAKKLLAEAGVAPGTVLSFPVTSQYPEWVQMGIIAADQLKKIGLELKVEQLDPSVLQQRNRAKEYHLAPTSRRFRNDPDGTLSLYYQSTAAGADGYKNPEVDRLLDAARIELNRAKRKEMYLQIQKIVLDEVPTVFIHSAMKLDAIQEYVKGYVPTYTGYRETLVQTWLDKK